MEMDMICPTNNDTITALRVLNCALVPYRPPCYGGIA